MDAMEFLKSGCKGNPHPVYVVYGEETYLRGQVHESLRRWLIGDGDPALALARYSGDEVDFASVRTELETIPFLSDHRIVFLDQADKFVTRYRGQLEHYAQNPARSGILILDVKSWTSTTKLARLISEKSTIKAEALKSYKVPDWCVTWAQTRHGKNLTRASAGILVDLAGNELGILAAELAKLSDFVGEDSTIGRSVIERLAGRNHSGDVFRILDHIAAGRVKDSLTILDELLEKDTSGIMILAAMMAQLRRLALAARAHKLGVNLEQAMDQAGVPQWQQARQTAHQLLKHFGWNRIDKLYEWMIECDQGMKGASDLSEKALLQRFIVRLARPRTTGAS